MISHASDLLEKFIEFEKEKISEFDMPHMPTLGSAYEEITKNAINKAYVIPENYDLNVVSGFITVGDKMLPQQIDCMLVHGEGKKYGLTSQFIYPIEQVLCIFEVKKNLRKSDLVDAYYHLGSIRRAYAEHFEDVLEKTRIEPNIQTASKHFSQITGRIAPRNYLGLNYLSKSDGMLFYTLVHETLAPLSIVHGYGGYTTEKGLRTVFLDFLEEKMASEPNGFGVPSFPSLITSNDYCLIKGNGLPFLGIDDERNWVAILSSKVNQAKIILEQIWSKLSVYFNLKMPWGPDLAMENLSPLLLAIPKEDESRAGWFYRTIEYSEAYLAQRQLTEFWKPTEVSSAIITSMMIMAGNNGKLSTGDGSMAYVAKKHIISIDDLKKQLLATLEFVANEQEIFPLANSLYLLTTEDEKSGWISSDQDRFDEWCETEGIKNNYFILMAIV